MGRNVGSRQRGVKGERGGGNSPVESTVGTGRQSCPLTIEFGWVSTQIMKSRAVHRTSKLKHSARNPESPLSNTPILDSYLIGDARRIGEILPKVEFINTTVTSPPYWDLKNYGVANQIGFGQSYQHYLDDLKKVFEVVYERTKSNGCLWLITDTLKTKGAMRLLPFDLARVLTDIGWRHQDIIIWQKDRTLPWSHQGKLRNIFEYICLFTKSSRFKYRVNRVRDPLDVKEYWIKYPERYSPQGKTPSRMWKIPIPRQGSWGKSVNYVRHSCPLPPELISRLLLLSTDKNDIVLDPFAGSGSVLAQAKAMGRHFIGIDLSRPSKHMFENSVLPTLTIPSRHADASALLFANQQRFGLTIRKLRALKYAREVLKSGGRDAVRLCTLLVAVPLESPETMRYTFLFKGSENWCNKVRSLMENATTRAPLSKYGISVELHLIPLSKLRRLVPKTFGFARDPSVYLYEKGRFYTFTRRQQLTTALGDARKLKTASLSSRIFPPIVSTIGISATDLSSLRNGTSNDD